MSTTNEKTVPTIFEKIANRELPGTFYYENNEFMAIQDINPEAKTHVLVIPKQMVISFDEYSPQQKGQLFEIVTHVAEKVLKLPSYVLKVNVHPPIQEVMHVHVHILSHFKHKAKPLDSK